MWNLFDENQNRLKDFPTIKEEIFFNELGIPNGRSVDGWKIPEDLPREAVEGQCYRVEPLMSSHHPDLLEAFSGQDEMWKYSQCGPFEDSASFKSWIETLASHPNQMMFSVINKKTNKSVGMAAFVAINPEFGSIQIGHVHLSTKIQVVKGEGKQKYTLT